MEKELTPKQIEWLESIAEELLRTLPFEVGVRLYRENPEKYAEAYEKLKRLLNSV